VLRLAPCREVSRRAHDGDALVFADPDSDHVAADRLAEVDSGVEGTADEVCGSILKDDVETNVRVRREKLRKPRLQNLKVREPRHAEPQRPGGSLARLFQRTKRVVDRRERRYHALEKASAGFGERDVSGRAVEQAHANTLFELADDLADPRGREPELRGGGSETAPFGDDHELGEAGEVGRH